MISATATRTLGEAAARDLHFQQVVVLVDVDGTIADNTWRGPFEWAKVGSDNPIMPVISVVQALHQHGCRILFVSGRKEQCRLATVKWIRQFVLKGLPSTDLFMRRDDDNRPDVETKSEIYENFIEGKFHILCVIDDRASVVKMWREKGLTVLQCAEGNF